MSSEEQTPQAPGNGNGGPDRKPGVFGRIAGWFDRAVQEGRGGARNTAPLRQTPQEAHPRPSDPGARRGRNAAHARMVIPVGAVVSGSLETAGDAEIAGRVEGDITLKGELTLFKSASLTGAVSAGSGHVDGTVHAVAATAVAPAAPSSPPPRRMGRACHAAGTESSGSSARVDRLRCGNVQHPTRSGPAERVGCGGISSSVRH